MANQKVKSRLKSFDETVININIFLEKARDYYKSQGDTEQVSFFNEILGLLREYNLDYFTLIDEIDNMILKPSDESINYLTNRLSELETRLIDLISKVMSIEVGGRTVSELIMEGSI